MEKYKLQSRINYYNSHADIGRYNRQMDKYKLQWHLMYKAVKNIMDSQSTEVLSFLFTNIFLFFLF